MHKKFPFLTLRQTLILLRLALAIVFLAHALVRVYIGTVAVFAGFMESKGFPNGKIWVWMITVYEIVGGILLLLGYFTKILSAGFILIVLVGIILIHASLGWFVGEHGTGGTEYSFILIAALLVTAAGADKAK